MQHLSHTPPTRLTTPDSSGVAFRVYAPSQKLPEQGRLNEIDVALFARCSTG